IHSFYERILRENCVEAGIDPQFEIASGSQSEIALQASIRRALHEWQDDKDEYAQYFVRQTVGQFSRNAGGAYEQIHADVRKVLEYLRASAIEPSVFEDLYESPEHYLSETQRFLISRLPESVQADIRSQPEKQWRDVARESLRILKLQSKYPWLKPELDSQMPGATLVCGVVRLALRAWRLFESEMTQLNQIDFSGLEARAVRLLETSPVVKRRVSMQYHHVMVDESQDLNPSQYRLVDAIESQSKLFVGDGKQSIYAFRNADVENFNLRARQGSLSLSKNHRSEIGILTFVDQVFSGIFGELYEASAPAPTSLDDPETSLDGVERWQLSDSNHWEDLAQRLKTMHQEGTPLKDICILVQKNFLASEIEAALHKFNIGTRMSAGQNRFYARAEVRDVVNLLQTISDPKDEFAYLAVLRSPIVGMSLDAIVLLTDPDGPAQFTEEDRAAKEKFDLWLADFRPRVDHLPAWEVLSALYNQSSLIENLAKQPDGRKHIENVRKLLAISIDAYEMSSREFAEHIRNIEKLAQDEGDAPIDDETEDLVTITTIHRAKGLEWPIVIVADAMSHTQGKANSPQFENSLGWVAYWQGQTTTYANCYVVERAKEKYLQELKRLQYVAATRAKKQLVLVTWRDAGAGMMKEVRQGIGNERFNTLKTVRFEVPGIH
ncbi:MAG TPA: 3'-5' exonuclease, partial [Fimbriimonas sp.]|nr:3'-5' exonuclease [Fimbriimonas sp.]